jgi:hypothetical protein
MSGKPKEISTFDVEEWMRLWETDPQGAENRRQREIEQLIMSAPEEKRQKLRRLQWRIDMERARHDNPMGRCVALYTMLTDHLWSDNGLYVAGPKLLMEIKTELENLLGLFRGTVNPESIAAPVVASLPASLVFGIVPPRSCVKQALSPSSSGA